jgi:hypothetical protein
MEKFFKHKNFLKEDFQGWAWLYTPVILTMWEVGAGGS